MSVGRMVTTIKESFSETVLKNSYIKPVYGAIPYFHVLPCFKMPVTQIAISQPYIFKDKGETKRFRILLSWPNT